MRKDRAHRYRTPTELADDIRNYLAGLPLAAGPESATIAQPRSACALMSAS